MATLQEQIEQLISENGAEAVLAAVKIHSVHPDGNTGGCPKGYVLVDGVCVLDI